MGFCYPGKAGSGDNPPRPECAPLWHGGLMALLPDIGLTVLVGHYAQAWYLGRGRKAKLAETVRAWRDYLPSGFLPMRSEEHTSELQSLMRTSYAVFCLKKKKIITH